MEDPANLQALTVVGDWLADASAADVFEHPVRATWSAASSSRPKARPAPAKCWSAFRARAPLNNGTGSHDLALNFGIRGLNPRLASRSTVLMDGIPVPFAPYGQPQLSLAPVSIGNMDAVTWSAAAARGALRAAERRHRQLRDPGDPRGLRHQALDANSAPAPARTA